MIITILFLKICISSEDDLSATFTRDVLALRQIESLCVLLIYIKAGYFLSLNEGCAPLLDQIQVVFYDIKYFMIIIGLYTCGFATSFTILAQSQIQFDDIPEKDQKLLEYGNLF